jgi:GrpB-like predicted nucleotidyltransferase (UPF0157 family)
MSNPYGLGLRQKLVRLEAPNPRWAEAFAVEAARIRAALGETAIAIEHVGSTSVPNIAAKPIVDMLMGIPAPVDIAVAARAFATIGYEHATWAGVPGHEVFGKGEPRTHLVHAVPYRGDAWGRMLAFRDALRSDPALAAEYAALKQDLAARFPDDRSVYTDGKSAFVARVLTAYPLRST